ncbi:FKBP-type peptidyl-prolyl cis-trans isomerase [Kaarinaea lacus]
MSILIGDNCVVSIHYTLTDDSGTVLDSSREGDPLKYLHGANNIIPGLENELRGKTTGASMQVTVAPEDAYGPHSPEAIQTVPRSAFEGVDDIQPGMQFQTEGPHGVQIIVVTEVSDDEVTIDANHPLAGKTLHFDVCVEDVRDATAEEIAHGHVH